jgi:hypothetical protein
LIFFLILFIIDILFFNYIIKLFKLIKFIWVNEQLDILLN